MTHTVACKDCDALWQVPAGSTATFRCPRCSGIVSRYAPNRLDLALALYATALICFLIANCFPILEIEAGGIVIQATIAGAAKALRDEQMHLIAVLVIATTVAIPALELGCAACLVFSSKVRPPLRALGVLFRIRERSRRWAMVDIFVLGVLVAIVKLGSVASIVFGAGIWFLVAYMVVHAAASHAFEPEDFWNALDSR